MDVDGWLSQATKELEHAGIGTARLDALILLEDATGIDRAKLLAEPEHVINQEQTAKLKNLLNKRADHTPLAYVRGHTEFYGREFLITPAVLEPRPESETMIDELKKLPDLPLKSRMGDVGTGSGAIGITAALEIKGSSVDLFDIDQEALEVAQTNVDKFTPGLRVVRSDLLAAVLEEYDVLLCNLPYVPDDYQINPAAAHEPRLAIFGGPDGLDLYRRLFQQLQSLQHRPLYILCESLPPQHDALNSIAIHSRYYFIHENDFITVYRRIQ